MNQLLQAKLSVARARCVDAVVSKVLEASGSAEHARDVERVLGKVFDALMVDFDPERIRIPARLWPIRDQVRQAIASEVAGQLLAHAWPAFALELVGILTILRYEREDRSGRP